MYGVWSCQEACRPAAAGSGPSKDKLDDATIYTSEPACWHHSTGRRRVKCNISSSVNLTKETNQHAHLCPDLSAGNDNIPMLSKLASTCFVWRDWTSAWVMARSRLPNPAAFCFSRSWLISYSCLQLPTLHNSCTAASACCHRVTKVCDRYMHHTAWYKGFSGQAASAREVGSL